MKFTIRTALMETTVQALSFRDGACALQFDDISWDDDVDDIFYKRAIENVRLQKHQFETTVFKIKLALGVNSFSYRQQPSHYRALTV